MYLELFGGRAAARSLVWRILQNVLQYYKFPMSRPLLTVALLLFCAASLAELPPPVAARLRAAAIPEDAMGVVIRRRSDGATVLSHGAQRPMQPASTLKLLTSIVALETLGPAFRGRTELGTDGEIADGVLRGDLVVRGGADVDLDWVAFERMLRVLRLRGVREIRGDLVLDRRLFNPARTDVGVAPFDESPEFRYNVIPDALLLNTNLVHLDLASDDREVRVAMTPPLEGVTLSADFSLVDRDCDDWEDGWKPPDVKTRRGAVAIRVHGEFPRGCVASTSINVVDRVAFADALFRSAWRRLGGTFRGRVRDGQAPERLRVLAEHRSRPLDEITRDINKRSDNPITRVVYLAIGAAAADDPATPTAKRAEHAVRAWLALKGIDADGLVLENGSGLSRIERIRPAQLAAVLEAALASPWAPEFLASLPIAALDGGMRRRLLQSPAAQRARLKTGTLRDASAVAGFVNDEAGEAYTVVAIINHPAANRHVARPILDALIDWLAASRAREAAR